MLVTVEELRVQLKKLAQGKAGDPNGLVIETIFSMQ
jgi:hypothetical protein